VTTSACDVSYGFPTHLATDVGQVSALCLLDLTAAFDTVDHQLLLHCLGCHFGVCGVVLAWFSSYLTDRSFRVTYNGGMSAGFHFVLSLSGFSPGSSTICPLHGRPGRSD